MSETATYLQAIAFILGLGLFFLTVTVGAMLWACFTKLEELCKITDLMGSDFADINVQLSDLRQETRESKLPNTLSFLKGEFLSRKDSEGVMLIEAVEKLLTKKRRKKNAISADSPSVA